MHQITEIIIDILATAVAAMLISLIKSAIAYISTRTHNHKVTAASREFQIVLEDGVRYCEQTMVSSLKQEDNWNVETQQAVMGACVDYVMKNLTTETLSLLTAEKDDIQKWLVGKIESEIQYHK